MGKKFFIGCLGIILLVIITISILTYSLFYRPLQAGFASLEKIHQANERIENREPYEPPEEGALTAEQVERFAATQESIRQRLEEKLVVLKDKYEDLGEEWDQRDPTFREITSVWREVLQLYADAKNIQVEALNEYNFSLSEYDYVRAAFYRALGLELLPYRIDAIAEAVGERASVMDMEKFTNLEQFERETREIPEETLEKNRELVSDYADVAEEWLVFAWWGL